ncbi:unnamed protein product [Lactuca virosa]|uniref:Uncharacterized protein n=1 Tax=Lactuca virosa TaxID=75947 RepID=A0AAU9PER5_9ASTR|nr:unnamed protein product [Lactuca virosa]
MTSNEDLLARNFDTRVAFIFLDLSGMKIAVALWDSFALKLNTYISQHHNETAPVIIWPNSKLGWSASSW